MDKNNFFVKNKSILTFLILEVIALTAFNFGNVGHVFGLAGSVLAIFGFVFVMGINKDYKSLLPVLIPVGLLLVISLIGSVNSFSKGFATLSNISLLFSLPCFLALGFFLRKLDDVKPRTVLLVVGGAFAAITLCGLFSTLIEYGFFYKEIYKAKPNYYYNGIPYDVTKEMYWLNGFEFSEVYIEYGSLFAVLCAAFLPGLLFLSPKKDKQDFIICAAIGALGVITLLLIPNIKAILIVAFASLFAFVYKFLRNHEKVLKITGISFVVLVGLALLFFIVALINVGIGYKFTGILNRLFVQNRYMVKVTPIFEEVLVKVGGKLTNLFGIRLLADDTVLWMESGMFEVQLIKEVGLIGTLLFAAFLIVSGWFMFHYIKKSKDEDRVKSIFIVMILAYFIYETLFYVVSIAPHIDSYGAFLRSPSLLVILFILGYIFTNPFEKEEKENE